MKVTQELKEKDRREAIEGIELGLDSMRRNAGKPAEEFFEEFFAEEDLLDCGCL